MMNNIHLIKTKKTKNINLYLFYNLKFSLKTKACLKVLSYLFADITIKYNSKQKMTRAKDLLYGASCNASSKTLGNLLGFNIQYSFINPKFLSDISVSDYLEFVLETLNNSIIDENNLKEAKEVTISSLIRKNDNPMAYAKNRVMELISVDDKDAEVFNESEKLIAEIKKIELDEVITNYKYILSKASLDIYLTGDIAETDYKKFNIFNLDNREQVKVSLKNIQYPKKDMIINEKTMDQSYLYLLYTCPYNAKSEEYYSFILADILFGVGPQSLLFDEIREKLSLCYSISVSELKSFGIVLVSTAINHQDKDLVITKINEQFQKIHDNNFDLEKLEMSKALIINSYNSLTDDLDANVEFIHSAKLNDLDYDIEKIINKIRAVSANDVSNVFKNYHPYFSYLLKGDKNEKNL